MQCSLLPPSLQWLVQHAPAFPINSLKVRVITEPGEFYQELKSRISSSKERVTLASLYLGNGKLEQDLVQTLKERAGQCPQLKVLCLLDYTRGSRQPHSSRDTLQPLLHHTNCQVSLFHTPELRGLLKRLLPQRWNEIIGLQHMKLYIFDDALLISGANLSSDYFSNRQDRYLLFQDVRELTDFFQAIVTAVSQHSLCLQRDGTVTLHPGASHHPFLGDYKAYCAEVECSIKTIWEREMQQSLVRLQPFVAAQQPHSSASAVDVTRQSAVMDDITHYSAASEREQSRLAGGDAVASPGSGGPLMRSQRAMHSKAVLSANADAADTVLFPTLQMKSFNVNYDELVTTKLLTSAVAGSIIHLATGYFNLTRDYARCVLRATGARYSILCAHPKANGFLGAAGAAGVIPSVYTHLLRQFLERVKAAGQQDRIRLWEYRRQGWTFHAKGLWYTLPAADSWRLPAGADGEGQLPCLTLVGSPNFGWRSVQRDLESQLVVVTRSPVLQRTLEGERARLYSPTTSPVTDDTLAQASRYVKFWVRCVVPVIKRLF